MQEIKFKVYAENNVENDVHKRIVQEKFWMAMRDINVNFKSVMKNRNILLDDVARLNIELNRLNMDLQIPMIDMVIMIFEKEYIPVRQFIQVLDSENMKILKKELIVIFKLRGHRYVDIDYLIT
jgi:hypothetical protein